MTLANNTRTLASILTILLILSATALTSATTENGYNNDNNLLTTITETTLTENGYKTNIIINPHVAGIYLTEDGYKLDLAINTNGIGGALTENGYQLSLIPEKAFPETPDIAVTDIQTSKTVIGEGYTLSISVTIKNKALSYETLHITIRANTTTITTQAVTLTSQSQTTITIPWDTTGAVKGNYNITAQATILPYEINTHDNTLFTQVKVTIPGDINGDTLINIKDATVVGINWLKDP